jgi:hypothetical protein
MLKKIGQKKASTKKSVEALYKLFRNYAPIRVL